MLLCVLQRCAKRLNRCRSRSCGHSLAILRQRPVPNCEHSRQITGAHCDEQYLERQLASSAVLHLAENTVDAVLELHNRDARLPGPLKPEVVVVCHSQDARIEDRNALLLVAAVPSLREHTAQTSLPCARSLGQRRKVGTFLNILLGNGK